MMNLSEITSKSNRLFLSILLAFLALCLPTLAMAQDNGGENGDVYEYTENSNDAQAYAQYAAIDQSYNNPKLARRILADIGITVGYEALGFKVIALAVFLSSPGWISDDNDEPMSDTGRIVTLSALGALFLLAPGLAVYSTHTFEGLDGMGDPAMGFAGSAIGGISGALIGALGFTRDYKTGIISSVVTGIVGSIAGAIIGYELSDAKARKQRYFSIQNVYPIIDISDKGASAGIGFQF